MNPNIIGNERQQNENMIAVTDALRLEECGLVLSKYFAKQDLSPDDYAPEQMALYRQMIQNSQGVDDEDWIKRSIMSDKAISQLSKSIENGALKIWRIHDAREVQVTPMNLAPNNIKYGVFKSFERPEPEMQGARLWVKKENWAAFCRWINGPNHSSGKGDVPPNRQLDHEAILTQAKAMLQQQPGLSKGSAAASIVADLAVNPRSGKPRDHRHIERMIAHLWQEGTT